jgi:hypothetical protein
MNASLAFHKLPGPERREREFIADFQLLIVDLTRAAPSTLTSDAPHGGSEI